MAVCIFWLLTYVGQGLDMAVGNRPVIIVQGGQEHQDYRQGSSSLRKKSELNSLSSNLLHLRIYPSEGSQRDELSNWLLLNEEPRISSWTPAGILIDEIMREPRELQTVFFALSPAVLNVLYSEYASSQPQQVASITSSSSSSSSSSEPLYDDPNLIGQRAKKLRIDCKHSRNTVSLPILVCDDRRRQQQPLESRQSNYEENLLEQRLSGAKTDLKRAGEQPGARDYQNHHPAAGGRGFLGSKPYGGYESGKSPGKRNHVAVGRRSIDHPHSTENAAHHPQIPPAQPPPPPPGFASQFMLRSTRGSLQYDVPQIECPVSEDGMERFACPTADRMGRYHCIDDHVLCDGFIDCPTGEDEDMQACMFYKTTKAHLDVLADAILRWARGR